MFFGKLNRSAPEFLSNFDSNPMQYHFKINQRAFFRITILVCFFSISLFSQEKRNIMKDTLDGKLDVSEYLTELHGFIPVPMIISEPAIGNFGVVLAAVFIAPQ